jgi:DNA-binding transcriptional regulator YiaG
MARLSKYHNEHTDKSKIFAENLFKELSLFTVEEVDGLQLKFGISDVDLANFLHLNRSVISLWKNGKRDITDYNKLTMYLFFKILKESS